MAFMARPIGFNKDRALNKALLAFWRKGYQATSLPELLAVMDIRRSSFYAVFSDKRTLFISCLDLFASRAEQVLLKALETMAPLDALQHFLERYLHGSVCRRPA